MKTPEGIVCPHCKSTDTDVENREQTNHYCYSCGRYFRTKGRRA